MRDGTPIYVTDLATLDRAAAVVRDAFPIRGSGSTRSRPNDTVRGRRGG